MWVQREAEGGSSCAIFGATKREAAGSSPLTEIELAAFLTLATDLASGLASFLAFALAANSYFTLRAIASVSTFGRQRMQRNAPT
jgi:hypothetical protein